MRVALIPIALLSAVALVVGQQVTPPPTLVQCAEAALTLQGGVAPYTVSILPGAQLSGNPLEVLPPVTAPGTVTWLVDIAEGQRVTFAIEDADGTVGYSAPVEIVEGDSSDCIGANASSRPASLVPSSTGSLSATSLSSSFTVNPTSTLSLETTTTLSASTDVACPLPNPLLPPSIPSSFDEPEPTTATSTATGGRGTVVVVRADSAASRGGSRSALTVVGVVLAACLV
ncbi:hypothetical protein JCM3775_005182 [Rhodotorula graminis]|uniref:Uncharacterized protein n=1 Tax=Rhodotorula graminis (strain WP1) TaxID=578459 RepID=A0A0P9EKN8_RHOGW|nr:uncharacterized protein RHOBADRAFT_47098 [Rhodotorula graminis WP1]KPV72254.1 hypothetical protein RHOBADRAFT_47098 [Rhodotorula graminis WP1]